MGCSRTRSQPAGARATPNLITSLGSGHSRWGMRQSDDFRRALHVKITMHWHHRGRCRRVRRHHWRTDRICRRCHYDDRLSGEAGGRQRRSGLDHHRPEDQHGPDPLPRGRYAVGGDGHRRSHPGRRHADRVDLNARAKSGQTYRVLFGVATPQGVNPSTSLRARRPPARCISTSRATRRTVSYTTQVARIFSSGCRPRLPPRPSLLLAGSRARQTSPAQASAPVTGTEGAPLPAAARGPAADGQLRHPAAGGKLRHARPLG
jgi:hypothetical protein